jgi:RNA-directed DNA polymerase
MARPQHLTALALARALLAGQAQAAGLAARAAACLGQSAPWQAVMAGELAAQAQHRWQAWQPHTLATWIEAHAGYRQAWAAASLPVVHRHILRPREHKLAAPWALQHCQLPDLPHAGALADFLDISPGALWRLTRPSSWQRRLALGQQHHRFQLMPKRRGGWRLLEVPEPYLLGLQRKLLAGLLESVPVHEACFGFVKRRSVVEHAQLHSGQAVLLKFDLQDFFSAVPASRVHAMFATLGYTDEVARLMTALCTVATPEPVLARMQAEGGLSWQQRQRLREPHLPQGAPTSPALANLCAFGLDLRLDGLAFALGGRYSRYADDLVLSGPPGLRPAMARVRARVSGIVAEEGFALNAAKTHLVSGGQQQVCGLVVNQHPNLPRAEFDRLKALLHQCVLHGPASQNRDAVIHWRDHLQGQVAWAAQVNPNKAVRLQRLWAAIDWSA